MDPFCYVGNCPRLDMQSVARRPCLRCHTILSVHNIGVALSVDIFGGAASVVQDHGDHSHRRGDVGCIAYVDCQGVL